MTLVWYGIVEFNIPLNTVASMTLNLDRQWSILVTFTRVNTSSKFEVLKLPF